MPFGFASTEPMITTLTPWTRASLQHLKLFQSGIDVKPISDALKAHPELWNQHTPRLNIYAHSDISDIWVRYNDFANYKGNMVEFNSEHDSVWYPSAYLLPVMPVIFKLMADVQGERLGGVLITKIPAGKQVRPHIDHGWHAGYYDKYAVQIESAEGQFFQFEDGKFHSEPGDIYQFDNSYTHWVTNDSTQDRITMIVCIKSRKETSCLGEPQLV